MEIRLHNHAWWCIPVFPALGRMKQGDLKLKATLGHITKPFLIKNNT
jgi:hypothetical protein